MLETEEFANHEADHAKFVEIQNIGTPKVEISKKDDTESFLEKVANVLTKEYYISDLFSPNEEEKHKK